MLLEIGIVLIFLLCFIQWRKRPSRFPPGPVSWPLIGNLVQVGMEPYKTVMKMRRKYGDIIGIDLGPKRTVFINEYKLLKKALNMTAFSGRPIMSHMQIPEDGTTRGIIFLSGKHWVEQRRFVFSYIQAGFRNGVPVEKLISHESKEMISSLEKYSGQPISTAKLFNHSAVNSLWSLITGERFSAEDEKYLKLIYHSEKISENPATLGFLAFFQELAKRMPKLSGYDECVANMKPLFKYAQEAIDSHNDTFQEGVERDFIDCYLKKVRDTTDTESSFFNKAGIQNLRHTIVDLFIAGNETVATTVRWIIFLMARYPDKQSKLRSVIANHIQNCGDISLNDRQKLPYVEALIAEVMRFSSIIPMALHQTTDDVEFHGYLIPKRTMVMVNLFGIHHDPEVWGDPENFRPERFLTGDESEVNRHPALIPFSIGKRICPGESLARDELFIFTVNLFLNFKIEFDPSEPIPPLKHILGSSLAPPQHKVKFQSRVL